MYLETIYDRYGIPMMVVENGLGALSTSWKMVLSMTILPD
jgi:beta-glucosidase/6-phospho-beta-glucosidase/beta-galactosidase